MMRRRMRRRAIVGTAVVGGAAYAAGHHMATKAEVSKKWFRVADTYGVDIAPGADDILILACTVVIDMMND